jgi:prepilin peptidase CpaA
MVREMESVAQVYIPIVAVLVVGCVACGFDIATRRIPNALTFGASVAALVFHLAASGVSGFGLSLAGLVVGLLLFFPIFALGGLGAGDVKLLACIGAWMGPMGAVWTAMYGAMAGAVMALGVVLIRGYARQAFANVWLLLSHWRIVGIRPLPELTLEHGKGPRLAYALPITLGALVTICLK